MVYKLGLNAEKGWQKLSGFQRLADIINSVKIIYGIGEEKFERKRNAAKSCSHSPHLTITPLKTLIFEPEMISSRSSFMEFKLVLTTLT
jgi:hypothetical protein